MTKETEWVPEEKDHCKKYSPSSLEMLERCPRFIQQEKENKAANDGARLHYAAETNNPDMIVDAYERELVLKSIFVRQQLMAKFPDARVYKEKKLNGVYNYGTGDFVMADIDAGVGVVEDDKYGEEPVTPAEWNIQIWNYVLNWFTEIPRLHTIYGAVFQPRLYDEPSIHEFKREDIPMIMTRIEQIIERHEDPFAKATPDAKACSYCGNKAQCEHWWNTTFNLASQNYGIEVPKQIQMGIIPDGTEISRLHFTLARVKEFCEQYDKLLAEESKTAGIVPEGCSLINRKGNLKVTEAEKLIAYAQGNGVTLDQLLAKAATLKAKGTIELVVDATEKSADEVKSDLIELKAIEHGKDILFLKKKSGKVDVDAILDDAKHSWNNLIES